MSHDEAVEEARMFFEEGLRALRRSVDLLRGPDVEASEGAMRTEMALSRAIETLVGNCFRVPPKGKP